MGFPFEYQLDAMDCGSACLKIIAKHYGKYYSLQYLRDLCGITRECVSFLDVSYGTEKIGLHTLAVKSNIQTLHEKVPFPCIIHWQNSHFIIVYKTSNTKIYVSDPAKGLLNYNWNKFKKGWYKNEEEIGAVLAIEPMADFLQRDLEQRTDRGKTLEAKYIKTSIFIITKL